MVLKYSNLNIINQKNDNITIVGEVHHSIEYENLVCSVIEDLEPDGIAVESSTAVNLIDGGIPQAKIYSSSMDIPLAVVDQNYKWLDDRLDSDRYNVITKANSYQNEVKEIGDVTYRTIVNSRNKIRDLYGENVYRSLFTDREEKMASRSKAFQKKLDGHIILICGAFHVPAIADMIDVVKPNIKDSRIYSNKNGRIYSKWS